jgi:hypothetical protein
METVSTAQEIGRARSSGRHDLPAQREKPEPQPHGGGGKAGSEPAPQAWQSKVGPEGQPKAGRQAEAKVAYDDTDQGGASVTGPPQCAEPNFLGHTGQEKRGRRVHRGPGDAKNRGVVGREPCHGVGQEQKRSGADRRETSDRQERSLAGATHGFAIAAANGVANFDSGGAAYPESNAVQEGDPNKRDLARCCGGHAEATGQKPHDGERAYFGHELEANGKTDAEGIAQERIAQ